jgi:hypothetical protein
MPVRVLLAGPDTLCFSCDLPVSEAMRDRLNEEKATAQTLANERHVHCPGWLGARVCPQGAKGGYAFLIETEDFSVKLLGERLQYRPSVYLEMRSYALHTHPEVPQGACRAALAWIREKLYTDQPAKVVNDAISFEAAKLSRADIHIDYQGGYMPSLSNVSEELRCFIRPGKTKGALYFQGSRPTGYVFGTGHVQARLYNKMLGTKEKANDSYAALLLAKNGETYDSEQDVWRLEFQLRREGATGFKLYAPPEADDDEAEIEAELAAEELQHSGTLPRFFARMNELVLYLTQHWLRLVEDNGSANRSRWPTHPTWLALREQFSLVAQAEPLDDDQRRLVRGLRYSGKNRLLRRMALGVVNSLEVEDASPTSAALLMLQRWMELVVEKEVQRVTARRQRYQDRQGFVPRWVKRGMGERFSRAEQLEHHVQMLLGIFSAKGVLPLESNQRTPLVTSSRSISTSWSKRPSARAGCCRRSPITSPKCFGCHGLRRRTHQRRHVMVALPWLLRLALHIHLLPDGEQRHARGRKTPANNARAYRGGLDGLVQRNRCALRDEELLRLLVEREARSLIAGCVRLRTQRVDRSQIHLRLIIGA